MISKEQAIMLDNLETMLDQKKVTHVFAVKNQSSYFYCLTKVEADAINLMFDGNCVVSDVTIGQYEENTTENENVSRDVTLE